jgi:hypothetical protein
MIRRALADVLGLAFAASWILSTGAFVVGMACAEKIAGKR